MSKVSLRRFWRSFRRDRPSQLAFTTIVILALGALWINSLMMNRHSELDTASVRPLLDLIARAESRGNYNAHFGNANNQTVRFTDMTIREVRQWQEQFITAGNPSSAVGRYQIISTTLEGLIRDMKLNGNERFNASMQDRMAITLLERRGAVQYADGHISREDFAANLAKEWASLPKVTGDQPEASFYAGDGLNASLVNSQSVLDTVDKIQKQE